MNKHIALMVALSNAGIDDETRHDLVHAWTNGRTQSSKELTGDEINDLIWKLNNDHLFANRPRLAIEALHENEMKRKRSIVLAIAQRTGLHTGTDFKRFNGWMKACSIHHKLLARYTMDELDQLIQQMHALEANYKASSEKAGTKAWHHETGIPRMSDS